MTRSASPKLSAYAGLAAVGMLAALATGFPELVALAAPFALLTAIGLVQVSKPKIDVTVILDRERVLEGDELDVTIVVEVENGAEVAELLLELPPELSVRSNDNPRALRLQGGGRYELDLLLICNRWGGFRIGRVFVRMQDAFGLFRHETVFDRRVPLKVFPREEALRSLLRPHETQVFLGNYAARERGEGIEFADLRPYVPGDRVRHVNWRASARRQELWVNEQRPERNADVVVFVDSFAEAGRGPASTLDFSVRAAATLVARYLQGKDRVGFVSFGGILNWLLPGTGMVQLYRIVDAMLDTQIVLSHAWKAVEVIPPRTLPPQALVVALTPLLDERSVNVLLDIRRRGFDLVVVDVSPEEHLAQPSDELRSLERRLRRLRREAIRRRFERVGVPVAVWDESSSLLQAVEEVMAFRRFAGAAHA
jgi:uncharacterized protein (DUF58 family)